MQVQNRNRKKVFAAATSMAAGPLPFADDPAMNPSHNSATAALSLCTTCRTVAGHRGGAGHGAARGRMPGAVAARRGGGGAGPQVGRRGGLPPAGRRHAPWPQLAGAAYPSLFRLFVGGSSLVAMAAL